MTRPERCARLHHSLVQAALPLVPVRAAYLDLPTSSLEDAPSHAACANSRTLPTPKLRKHSDRCARLSTAAAALGEAHATAIPTPAIQSP